MSPYSGKKVLVVDDEELIREIIVEELRFAGAQVFEAQNGTAALAALEKDSVDVVISDMRMPGGDGLFLLMGIAERKMTKPKLFVVSGYNDLKPEQMKNLGVLHVFPKPFEVDVLLKEISEYF
jgi:CheY-like chemotaxis protein